MRAWNGSRLAGSSWDPDATRRTADERLARALALATLLAPVLCLVAALVVASLPRSIELAPVKPAEFPSFDPIGPVDLLRPPAAPPAPPEKRTPPADEGKFVAVEHDPEVRPREGPIERREGDVSDEPRPPGSGTEEQIFVADEPPPPHEHQPVDELPDPIAKVKPVYPEFAMQAGVEGLVMIWALVGPDGRVRETRVHRSIPLLDDAAREAVQRWTFRPARTDGRAVSAWVAVPVRFSLH